MLTPPGSFITFVYIYITFVISKHVQDYAHLLVGQILVDLQNHFQSAYSNKCPKNFIEAAPVT